MKTKGPTLEDITNKIKFSLTDVQGWSKADLTFVAHRLGANIDSKMNCKELLQHMLPILSDKELLAQPITPSKGDLVEDEAEPVPSPRSPTIAPTSPVTFMPPLTAPSHVHAGVNVLNAFTVAALDAQTRHFQESMAALTDHFELRMAAQATATRQEMKDCKAQLTCAVADLQTLTLKYEQLQVEVQELKAEKGVEVSVQGDCGALKVECEQLRAGLEKATQEIKAVKSSAAAVHQDVAEQAERSKRAKNIILTGLVEEEGETAEALGAKVKQVLGALKASGVQVEQVGRLGSKTRTFAEVTAGTDNARPRVRPVVIRVASTTDKITVLRGRVYLQDSSDFRRLGVNTDLTRAQQANKNVAYPAFLEAKKAGKKVWWIDDRLMIEGKLHKLPVP